MTDKYPVQLRIGICGSAGVGKTSLANALARDLGLPCLREEMRDYLESAPANLMELPVAEVGAVLAQLWKEREQKESLTSAFVADNCPLDFAAYAMYYGCLDAQNISIFLAETLSYIARYDAIVLLPWGGLPYVADGIRPADQHLQLRYQFILEGLLRRYVDPQKLHFLPESIMHLDDRRSWVLSMVSRDQINIDPAAESVQFVRPGFRSSSSGFVYLVGAGPGDPGLMTVRALDLLQKADVVAHDLLVSPEILAQVPPSAELLPVGRRHGEGKIDYRLHPEVLARAQAGQVVVRLKCGDPLIFGRGGEEAEELAEAGIPFEIVPGISSALGAAAYSGIPLTHRNYASEVLFKTGHDAAPTHYGSASREPGIGNRRTTVLFMAARQLQANLDRLLQEGYSSKTPAAVVISATTVRQHVIVGTLADLSRMVPAFAAADPALLIAGDVVTLRAKIAWFEKRVLHGVRILVARARPGASAIAWHLRNLGAEVFEAPVVSAAHLDDYAELDEAMRRLREFDAVVFGCAAGVEATMKRLKLPGIAGSLRAIAIGEQAREALLSTGVEPMLTFAGSCRDALEENRTALRNKRLLLITSNEGRASLERELMELGATVEAVAAYRVFHRFKAPKHPVDLVVLPSSSAACLLLTSDLAVALLEVPMVAMGPVTESMAKQLGARHVVSSSHDDIESVVSCAVRECSLRRSPGAEVPEEDQVSISSYIR